MKERISLSLPVSTISQLKKESEKQRRTISNMADLIFHKYFKPSKSPCADLPEVKEIFDYWKAVMGKSARTRLTPDRAVKVRARLREGATVEQIKAAIDGCGKSSHHMGNNDTGTVYDDLTLICRNASKLEFFANNINKVERPADSRGRELADDLNDKSWAE